MPVLCCRSVDSHRENLYESGGVSIAVIDNDGKIDSSLSNRARHEPDKLGKTGQQTYDMIKETYGDVAMSRSGVFEWHKLFPEEGVNPFVKEAYRDVRKISVRDMSTVELMQHRTIVPAAVDAIYPIPL
ncbi:hypothetical protein TNCV_730911 [Trichonephila clavipes]|nr:hypothetical protein TNCV_730911 [Trichonephila clavipes]